MPEPYDELVQLVEDSENAIRPNSGKFEGCEDMRLASALYEASLEGWLDDTKGETGYPGGIWYGLIGRFIISEDSQGFFYYAIYNSEITARKVFYTIYSE